MVNNTCGIPLSKISMLFSTPRGGRFSRAPPFVNVLPRPESLIISPDLGSETCLKFCSETAGQPSVLFQNEIEPIFYPDQPVSPVISARQQIFSIRGGVLAIASCDARVVSRWFQERRRGLIKKP